MSPGLLANWLALPLGFRLGLLAMVGALAGGAVNWAAYSLAWDRRAISPWGRRAGESRAAVAARVPMVGWWWLRHEAAVHGRRFWLRPVTVELLMAAVFAALYYWECERLALWPEGAGALEGVLAQAHVHLVAHLFALTLMVAASLVDLDEKTIPDAITVTGALLALTAAAVDWRMLLPLVEWQAGVPRAGFVHAASPAAWPAASAASLDGLALGLACYGLWCVALLPRVWRGSRGWRWAWRIFSAHLAREQSTRVVGGLAFVGLPLVAASWATQFGWPALLTALFGMAIGGGVVWAVRLIGALVLRREAMGFGDVTLMAMIGAMLGWQAALLVFFLAPFCGLALGLAQWVLRRDNEIPYGPFLCLGAELVLVRWPAWWTWSEAIFGLGQMVLVALVVCLVMLGALLAIWEQIASRFTRD